MGKSQKKRAMRRHNPVRVPDSHLPKGLTSAAASSSKSEAILPIMQKMASPDSSERKWACIAVSNLIQNDPSTRRLLQGKDVIGALITRLTDDEEEVAIEASGALRNLCIDGGHDICAEMYNKNILVPLRTFIPKISTTFAGILGNPTPSHANARKPIHEFAESVITMLWCLSETSHKALNAVNQINLVPFLMSFLTSHDRLPLSTVTSAAHCLYVMTDDNPPVIEDVRSNAAYNSCFLSITQSNEGNMGQDESSLTLRVLACGILHNISPLPPPSTVSLVDVDKDVVLPLLQPVISSLSLVEVSDTAQRLLDQEAQASAEQKPSLILDNFPRSDHKTVSEMELEGLENKLRTVQLALEILTGICATLPEPDPEETNVGDDDDEREANEDEDSGDDDMAVDDEPSSNVPAASTATLLPALVNPLLALIQPTTLSFNPVNSSIAHPPLTSALGAIHIGALECLNNVFLSLGSSLNTAASSDIESGKRLWNGVWSSLGTVGTTFGPGQERRREMWEVAVGVLWGISNLWKGHLIPDPSQVGMLIQFCDATTDARIKVRCIGALECLAQHPQSIETNLTIANYMLSMIPTATSNSPLDTEPLIQCISALIDIYSDENMPYDVNFRQGRFQERLLKSINGVKKAIKTIDRRKEGGKELRRRGEEVHENLVAFVEYRKILQL